MPDTTDTAHPSVDYISLADDEWGNEIMRAVADEHFAAHPELQFVHIYEHAGWCLAFHRSGQVVGTANDSAVFSKDTEEIRQQYARGRRRHTIRRDELSAIPTPHSAIA